MMYSAPPEPMVALFKTWHPHMVRGQVSFVYPNLNEVPIEIFKDPASKDTIDHPHNVGKCVYIALAGRDLQTDGWSAKWLWTTTMCSWVKSSFGSDNAPKLQWTRVFRSSTVALISNMTRSWVQRTPAVMKELRTTMLWTKSC